MRKPYERWVNLVCETGRTRDSYLNKIRQFEDGVRREYGLDIKNIPED